MNKLPTRAEMAGSFLYQSLGISFGIVSVWTTVMLYPYLTSTLCKGLAFYALFCGLYIFMRGLGRCIDMAIERWEVQMMGYLPEVPTPPTPDQHPSVQTRLQ